MLKWRSCRCFAVRSVDTIPNAVRSQLSTKILLGSAPARTELRIVSRLQPRLALLVSLRLCLCRWTARKKTGHYQVPSTPENWSVSKWGFVVALDTERALVWTLYKRAWQVGFLTASRKAERLSGLMRLDRRQNLLWRSARSRKPYKKLAFNFAF